MSNDAVGKVRWNVRGVPVAEAASEQAVNRPTIPATLGRAGDLVHAEPVMGTVVSFRVFPGRAGVDSARAAIDVACEVLHEVDATFSIWKPDSPISRLRRGELLLTDMVPRVAEVLELCRHAKASSRGWFDPWAMPGGVDPTGLVKGWSLDIALGTLREAGFEAALLNAGGDLVGFGNPGRGDGWRIGIRHPWLRDALAGVVQLRSAVATSGPYERGAHLVDPRSGEPAQTVASATVTGPNLATSDALATALAVGGDDAFDAVASLDGYEAYVIGADGSERATPGMVFLD